MAAGDPEQYVVSDFEPAYLHPAVRQSMAQRVSSALAELQSCTACPRNCRVNRLDDESKFCNTGRYARVSSAFPHLGEEDCLRGWAGSGTIFFAGCNLRCVFCQNADISQFPGGQSMKAADLAALMADLQSRGCHNINFVTPEHVVPQVVEALDIAIDAGLTLPIVYNTSAYDAVESLKLMDGLVDIYMPDFKFWDSETARGLCKARDYPQRAKEAITEMHRQVGELRFTRDGLACRGLLVRHLVMPGQVDQSAAIFRWLAESISPDTFVNIMPQYRPAHEVGRPPTRRGERKASSRQGEECDHTSGTLGIRYPQINRSPTPAEIAAAREAALASGLWRFDERRL